MHVTVVLYFTTVSNLRQTKIRPKKARLYRRAFEAVDQVGDFPQRKGRVCAGNPRRVSCAIEILSFQTFYKVLKGPPVWADL